MMKPSELFQDLQTKISDLLKNSPVKDIEQNIKAMLTQGFAKLDLVTREEFEIQTQVLARTRAMVEELEQRIVQLERQLNSTQEN
ncbi:accessory factor UbiK family protein [Mycoavidus sp. B2-EB]|uniref:accessory factor UbiK family protein n=1 Tax=Mycoavidus sp. B2-EB TaxID=2651972 RepID=UPI0016282839|nr:accessory factor UbiK family protein [Mycoavidus sp. B2-EB]